MELNTFATSNSFAISLPIPLPTPVIRAISLSKLVRH